MKEINVQINIKTKINNSKYCVNYDLDLEECPYLKEQIYSDYSIPEFTCSLFNESCGLERHRGIIVEKCDTCMRYVYRKQKPVIIEIKEE